MPYYRIVIWTSRRREPFTGIRQIDNYNIDAVHHIMRVKAEETYRRDFIDVEVQMISKVSTAVRKYLDDLQKKRASSKKSAPTPFELAGGRREHNNQRYRKPLEIKWNSD